MHQRRSWVIHGAQSRLEHGQGPLFRNGGQASQRQFIGCPCFNGGGGHFGRKGRSCQAGCRVWLRSSGLCCVGLCCVGICCVGICCTGICCFGLWRICFCRRYGWCGRPVCHHSYDRCPQDGGVLCGIFRLGGAKE